MKLEVSLENLQRQWPEADRNAWQGILTYGDLFDELGTCSTWSTATRRGHRYGYGEWLSFVVRTRPADMLLGPTRRVTPERVTEYLDGMSNRPDECLDWRVVKKLSPGSIAIHIETLDTIMRAFAPHEDWVWLRRAARKLIAEANLQRQMPYLGVSAMELSRWALCQIAEVEGRSYRSPRKQALAYRNALAVAVLIHCPVRRRAFCALDVVERVQRTTIGYLLQFRAEDMKDRWARRFSLHRRMTAPMDVYLQRHRPVLLDGAQSSALWITQHGAPMIGASMHYMIGDLTEKNFRKRLSLHDFRRVDATSIAEYKPERAGIIRDVLGHSTMEMADRHYNQARALEAIDSHQQVVESVMKRARQRNSKRDRKPRR